MDKTKVLIIGASECSRWMAHTLGLSGLFDVERQMPSVGTIGHKADIIVSNFSELEERMVAHLLKDGVAGYETIYDGINVNVKFRGLHDMLPVPMIQEAVQPPPDRRKGPKGPRGKWGKLK